MKRGQLVTFFLLLTGIKTILFAGAGQQTPERYFEHFSKYNFGLINSINETVHTPRFSPPSNYVYNNTDLTYFGNGLFSIDYERFNIHGKVLYYNEMYNDNIDSPNKINENIEIMHDFIRLEYVNENTLEIEGNFIQKRAILKFDVETKRLTSFERYFDIYPNLRKLHTDTEILYFEYDNYGRLSNIHTLYNGTKLMRKSIYYDGILRIMDNNFFIDWGIRNTEEIVIYENGKLVYHLEVKSYSGDTKEPVTIDELNRSYYFMVHEYDENGYEIKQTKYSYRQSNEPKITINYYIDNLLFDERNNWIKRVIYHYWDNEKITDQEQNRTIIYK